jgi:hypothetical protein
MKEARFEDVRKIGKVGKYSYCVTIPREIVRALGWKARQRAVVGMVDDRIVIRDWEK